MLYNINLLDLVCLQLLYAKLNECVPNEISVSDGASLFFLDFCLLKSSVECSPAVWDEWAGGWCSIRQIKRIDNKKHLYCVNKMVDLLSKLLLAALVYDFAHANSPNTQSEYFPLFWPAAPFDSQSQTNNETRKSAFCAHRWLHS